MSFDDERLREAALKTPFNATDLLKCLMEHVFMESDPDFEFYVWQFCYHFSEIIDSKVIRSSMIKMVDDFFFGDLSKYFTILDIIYPLHIKV